MAELLKRLGIEHPIIQGPMGGGPSTPELAAAVSNACGLGSLGVAYLTARQITEVIQRTRSLTNRPFNVNLFAGGWRQDMQPDASPMLSLLTEIHQSLGLPPPTLPTLGPDPFPDQLEALLDARPEIFSFTFGIPDRDTIARLRARGIAILGTATTVEEGRLLAAADVDAIIAQGAEAGAHRGTFAGPFETSLVPMLELVREIAAAVPVPVIAAGGIMDGAGVKSALEAGAAAAMLGTAFLASPESGAAEVYKRAIINAGSAPTVITRAFSGRPARGLVNDFIRMLEGHEDFILPYPLQNALTRTMRTGAAKQGKAGFLSLWAGTGVAHARGLPAGELVLRLVRELNQEI